MIYDILYTQFWCVFMPTKKLEECYFLDIHKDGNEHVGVLCADLLHVCGVQKSTI